MWSNCASRSGCFEPSSALRLYWREKPSFTSSLRTVSAPIGCPMAVRIAANLSMLFDTHSSGRMGSPSVAGSRSASMRARDRDLSRDSLAAGAGTAHLTFRQFLAIEIVLAAIDGRTGKPGDPRDHRKPAPAGRSHLARREHPPPAFVKLRADHAPAIANRIFIDHAIRDTSVRLDPESRRPESTRRSPAHRDSLIVRGGLTASTTA